MAQELLDRTDVVPALQEVGGEGVAQGVAGGGLGQGGTAGGVADRSLHDRFVEMMAEGEACLPFHGDAAGREDVLPSPFALGAGILAGQGVGEEHPAQALAAVSLVGPAESLEVAMERFLH